MANKEASLLLRIKQLGTDSIDKAGEAFTRFRLLAVAAFAAVGAAIAKSVAAYEEEERAVNSLNQALLNQGIYTAELSKKYQDLASELEKSTRFESEAILSSQALLQSYLGQTQVTEGLIKATMNLAQAKGIDLRSAADLVGKSIGTSTNALQRQGIELGNAKTKTEKLTAVTEALNQKFGGQAEAAIRGQESSRRLAVEMDNLQKKVGSVFAPAVQLASKELVKFIETAITSTGAFDLLKASVVGTFAIWFEFKRILGSISVTLQGLAKMSVVVMETITGGFQRGITAYNQIDAQWKADQLKLQQEHNANMASLEDSFSEAKKARLASELEALNNHHNAKAGLDEAAKISESERFAIKSEEELARAAAHAALMANEQDRAELESLNKTIAKEKNTTAAVEAERKKRVLLQKYYDKQEMLGKDALDEFDEFFQQKSMRRATEAAGYLSRLQNSKNSEMVAIGKAAAIANIGIDTARGAVAAYAALAPIPFVGPGLGAAAAAAMIAYGAEQTAQVAGIQLAEGGIVKSRPGGIQATIGEGGRDEAVIPLDDDRAAGVLGGVTININAGAFVGDQASAREFARFVDHELYRMKRSNESLSFDGVT